MIKKLAFILSLLFSVSLFAAKIYTVEIDYPSAAKIYTFSSLSEMFNTSFDRLVNYQTKDGSWFCVTETFSMGFDANNNMRVYLRMKEGMDTGKF
jgi:hypothetical protein